MRAFFLQFLACFSFLRFLHLAAGHFAFLSMLQFLCLLSCDRLHAFFFLFNLPSSKANENSHVKWWHFNACVTFAHGLINISVDD